MDLILWRHAEAFEMREVGDDLQRALTPKGERQAQRMAQWLNRHLPSSTRVLASPARRAQQTAEALERKFKTLAALSPERGPHDLLAAARWPESREPVLLVGHQPALGMVAALLLCGEPQPWAMRKAAVWWLRHRDRDGDAQVVLQAVMGPDGL